MDTSGVVLALLTVVGAGVAALIVGGRLRAFTDLDVHGLWFVVAAIAAQLIGGWVSSGTDDSGYYIAGLAISAACGLAFCLRNLQLSGVPLVTIGLALNALVVGLNSAMPVSIFAASRANVSLTNIATGADPRHTIAGYGSTWRGLGDVIPVPLPVVPEVASPGDVLIAAGLAEFVVIAMTRRPSRPRFAPPQESVVALSG
jgi:hypothetical protein